MDNEYGFEPPVKKSLYLRLKQKGDSVTLRIASPAYREPVVWKEGVKKPLDEDAAAALTPAQWADLMRDPDYNITDSYHWIVIDRDTGEAKIFTGTESVYRSIKDYAMMSEWGNPRKYDIKITRTEEPGRNYYSVKALPGMQPLSDKEQQLVEAVDITDKRPNARAVTEKQLDDISEWVEAQEKGGEVGNGGSIPGAGKQRSAAPVVEAPAPTDEDFQDNDPIDLSEIPF